MLMIICSLLLYYEKSFYMRIRLMRKAPLTVGIILLMLGTGAYFYVHSYLSEAQRLLSQIIKTMNPKLQQTYQLPILIYKVVSGIIAAIGLGFLIHGAVAMESPVLRSQVQGSDGPLTWSPTSNEIFCRYCDKLTNVSSTSCSKCGKPIRSTSSATKKCSQCQATMTEDSEYCANCGKKLEK